jgi:hypothetical protein
MSGAIPQFPQYAFMAWCSAKAQGQHSPFIYSPHLISKFRTLAVFVKCNIRKKCFMHMEHSLLIINEAFGIEHWSPNFGPSPVNTIQSSALRKREEWMNWSEHIGKR